MKRFATLFLLPIALAACSADQATGQAAQKGPTVPAGAPQAPAKFYREGLANVDFSGLDSVQKERALQILNGHRCDCGCGMTLAQCRVEDKTCPRSPALAAAVVSAIRSGQSDQQAVATLQALLQKGPAPAADANQPVQPVAKVDIDTTGAPSLGPDTAAVTVVEFSDFQWPYCARAEPVLKQIVSAYPSDVRVAFKHYPLPFHQNAKPAALATAAAHKQNKFWEMHDLIFKNQAALDAASLKRYAQSLGLDMAEYDRVVADPETSRAIDQEMLRGQQAGVRGTPTFFVNGVQAPSWDLATMKKLIEVARSGGDVGLAAGQVRAELMAQQARARANQPPPVDYSKVYQIDVAGAAFKGPASAPVTIIEFSDYQWPYCAGAEPLFKQVLETYPQQVRFVYKHYPLSFHPNARPASEAALFAKQHGKFWEMHELIFKNYQALTMDNLKSFARQLGLDDKALESSVGSQAFKAAIDKDIDDGRKAAVTGTPTVFINGKRLPRRDFDTIKKMIDELLGAKGADAASR